MSLDRLTTVLEAVAIAGQPLSAAEVKEITQLPLPTCYRLLNTLKEQQLVEDLESNNRYVIGRRLLRIAFLAKNEGDICSLTAPALSNASDDYGVPVFLSRIRTQGVSIIHVETPSDPSISYTHPGLGYRPMHACSCSKAIAAFSDDGFKELILNGPMKTYTDQTHTCRRDLENEFSKIRKKGYAECVEEIEIGVSSVAAPLQVADGGAVFSVGAIGPIRKFNQRYRSGLGKKLIGLAAKINADINSSYASLN